MLVLQTLLYRHNRRAGNCFGGRIVDTGYQLFTGKEYQSICLMTLKNKTDRNMTKRLKKLLYLALFTGCAIVSSCEKPEQVGSDVDSRISALEDRVSVLETIVNASENGDLITSVTPLIENGLLIGYVIEFQKGAPITVYCGKDGLNGSNGTDGSNGKDGDSMFKSVTVTDAEVVFVTSDGHSFVVRRAMALRIEFDSADLVVMGTNLTRDIHYSITSETDDIEIEALSSADIKVKVVKIDAKTGTLNVKLQQGCGVGFQWKPSHYAYAVF